MNDSDMAARVRMNSVAAVLTDLAELEQLKAENANKRASEGTAGQAVIALGERDRHIARSRAFIEAARLVLNP